MPDLVLTDRELTARSNQVRALLRPLLGNPQQIACSRFNVPNRIILGAHQGQRPSSPARDWFFATSVKGLRGQYFEEWDEYSDGRGYWLRQTALHLCEVSLIDPFAKEVELIAVHSEPSLPDGGAEYKRGLHLHLSESRRFKHAHIPITDGFNDTVLESIPSLTEALQRTMMLVSSEIFGCV